MVKTRGKDKRQGQEARTRAKTSGKESLRLKFNREMA
jgi:hypothetical protein